MRVVVDSNVLVSALLGRGASRRLLLRLMDGHTLVSSVELFAEVEDVLSREKFCFTRRSVEDYLQLLAAGTEVIHIEDPVPVVIEDPDDDNVLAVALTGKADYIISGDKHLLTIGEYKGVRIVTVRKMLSIIGD